MQLPPQPFPPAPLHRLLPELTWAEIPAAIVLHAEAVPSGVLVRGTPGLLKAKLLKDLDTTDTC